MPEDLPLEAIGEMTVAAGRLEVVAHGTVWVLLNDDSSFGRAVTQRLPLNDLASLLEGLARVEALPSEAKLPLRPWAERLRDLGERRKRLIHGLWLTGADGQPTKAPIRDLVKSLDTSARIDPAKIESLVADINALVQEMLVFIRKLLAERSVSPARSLGTHGFEFS